jgi:hypothetical protein
VADPILKNYSAQALAQFERAATALALRQAGAGAGDEGNVVPWPGSADRDFHGTLAAIWIWARHQSLSGDARFAKNRAAGWRFVEDVWRSFIPEAIGPEASDEAAFDCALVLRAALGEQALGAPASDQQARLADGAARVLAAHLGELDAVSGRDFQDPGFLAWNLIEYARAFEDRGLLAAGRRFVERAFGMKSPPIFATEPEVPGALFDFSSTTATRVLAVIASEGNTPFVGAWLRERVAGSIPPGFVTRAHDERCWNASVAALLGRAYVVSTEVRFLDAYRAIRAELERRNAEPANGASAGPGESSSGAAAETLLSFYLSLAADALVRPATAAEPLVRGAHGGR